MPQFGDCDCCYRELFVWMRRDPALEVEGSLLSPNDHIGVDDYRHLSAGALSFLRAACRSRCQARASASGNSTVANASARSRPVQTFPPSGTRRATGEPFFRRTKV